MAMDTPIDRMVEKAREDIRVVEETCGLPDVANALSSVLAVVALVDAARRHDRAVEGKE